MLGELVGSFQNHDAAGRGGTQLLPGRRGVALEIGRRAEKHDGDFAPGFGEQAGGHHAVAAIVAAAAEDGHALRAGKELTDAVGNRGRCVAHELQGGNAEALGGDAIAGLHLRGGEDSHGRDSRTTRSCDLGRRETGR